MFQRRNRLTAGSGVLMLVLGTITLASTATAAAAPPSPELCGPGSAINYNAGDFLKPTTISNKWLSLKPGMQFTTTGTVTSADGVHEHSVVHTVTGLTKVIGGVTTRVLWDRDYQDGQLQESELAFFAQDRQGSVWLFGEYPEEYEGGTFVGAPSTFIHGLAKAQAGTMMPAKPSLRAPDHVQAYAPKVGFLDCGTVFQKNQQVCVPTGCYDDVLVIDEYNPLEPPDAGHQRKFYSAGTGLIKVTAVGGPDQEFMDLVSTRMMSAAQLDEANAAALEQDRRGYSVSRSVYAKTSPAEVQVGGS
ncbi:hypothetical protein [Arthrobacter sp. CJ23]|uniref:hypothetical protein n=1 Tax=Arthrobacter sp. CJ23 TaxID=2972479 RepID=UPI00215C7903|nr:hypothetical protein [Arthrobacter sp. CJ23]UVJ37848.1 hypothetical protein NVV90_11210 [Arthrobacter sp. CJ23]